LCYFQVVYLSDLPGNDVAEKTRAVLKRLVSDKAQMMFNYEGRGQKKKLSIKKFPRILSAVYGNHLGTFFFSFSRRQQTFTL